MRTVDPELTAKRRRQILDAALICFQQKGFHGAAMSAICKQARMSAGNLYHYFSSKEDLIEAIVEEDSREVEAIFARFFQSEDPVEAFFEASDTIWTEKWKLQGALNCEIMAEAVRNPRIRVIIRQREARVRGEVATLLTAAKAAGRIDQDVDAEGFGRLLISLVQGLTLANEIDDTLDQKKTSGALRQMLERTLYGGERSVPRRAHT